MNVSQRISNILNYYQDNPECDPNLHEFFELCYDMVQYLNKAAPNYGLYSVGPVTDKDGKVLQAAISEEQRREQYPIAFAVYEKFKILSQQVEQKLLGNELGITKESPLYQLFSDLTSGVKTYSAFGDTPLKAKLGGISLFIAQQKRDVEKGLIPEFIFDNVDEIVEIQRLNEELYDPQSGGHYTSEVGETDINKMTYVKPDPSPRQLLLEEIMNEFQKGSKTR